MNPIELIVGTVFKVIDKVIPDPAARDALKLELVRMEQAKELEYLRADLQVMQGQVEINKLDAAADNILQSGWRPSVGWVCSAALAYEFIGRPLLAWLSGIAGFPLPPALDVEQLITLLFALLGLGGYRTVEKLRGRA